MQTDLRRKRVSHAKVGRNMRGVATQKPNLNAPQGRQRAGTLSLKNLDLRLTKTEAETLASTDRMTAGMFTASVTGALPLELPRMGADALVRIGGLPVPEAHASRLSSMPADTRQRTIRAALQQLQKEHAQDRWQLTTDLHPGTPLRRDRISVGPGQWVTRAVWRKSTDGLPRAGYGRRDRPMSANGAKLGGLGDLWELIDANWQVIEVFEAQSLHDAARLVIEGQPRRTIDPSLLMQAKESLT